MKIIICVSYMPETLAAELAGAVEYACPRYESKPSEDETPVLENVEYSFIAIPPRSTSTPSGRTC